MNFKSIGLVVAAVAGAYLVFVVASGLGFDPLGQKWNFETVGQLGDSFGPLNTFMAGLAAIGALGAFFAQKQELADAKAEATKERALSAKRDFEATLFNLIELFRDTAREIEVTDIYNNDAVSGRDAINRLVEEKLLYTRILRASLSNSEIVLLALNCLHGEGQKKFKPFVEKYALLHNVSEDDARHWGLAVGFGSGAFGARPNMLERLQSSAAT